jgi:chromate transporter
MYGALFLAFLRIGAFTVGGGYAMLPHIETEVVRRQWMNKEELLDLIAIAQSMPGILAVNIAILIGHRLHKIKGAIICTLATILPSFLIILCIALFFTEMRNSIYVEKIFKALRPVVVALIAAPALSAARTARIDIRTAPVPIAVALLIWLAGLSPVYIVLIAVGAGIIQHIIRKSQP